MKLVKHKNTKVLFELLKTTDHVQVLIKTNIKWIAISVFSGYPHDVDEDFYWIGGENNLTFSDLKEFYILDK